MNGLPKEGDLRVYWFPDVPCTPMYLPIDTVANAQVILDALAQYDLFLTNHGYRDDDFGNAGGLEVFEDGEWLDWVDEEGRSIDELWQKEFGE